LGRGSSSARRAYSNHSKYAIIVVGIHPRRARANCTLIRRRDPTRRCIGVQSPGIPALRVSQKDGRLIRRGDMAVVCTGLAKCFLHLRERFRVERNDRGEKAKYTKSLGQLEPTLRADRYES
jgi:hypothetical protein